MEHEEMLVLAYVGPDSEVLFLQTLLSGAGIACSVDRPTRGYYMTREARLFVAKSDQEAAAPLIREFRDSGTKSNI